MRVFLKNSVVVAAFLVISLASYGQSRRGSQIVDDSTRNVYGPTTTRWTTEEDIFFNRKNYQPIDTSINNYHRWTYPQRFNNTYKDLGNIGTALYPIFPKLSQTIGVSTGFNVYDPFFDTQEPKYFDTKSPYTRMRIIWGGDGRAMTNIEFSRNINPRWNFGFNYRPILVDKQIQRTGKGDRQTISHYYDIYTAYQSKNEKYRMLVNYRRIRHLVNENGGISVVLTQADSTYSSLFSKNNTPKLTAAGSIELQNKVHLFQEYKIGTALQVYHKMDLGKEINQYKDDLSKDPKGFYDVGYDTAGATKISDSTRFSFWINEIGLKGKVGKVFYNGYVKAREYKFRYKYFTADTLALPMNSVEYYIGGRVSYEYDSVTHLTGWAEYLTDGNYGIQATLNSKWIDAKATSLLSKPSFVHNAYRGSFDLWNNQFSDITSLQVEAFGKLEFGRFKLSPGFTYTSFQNYIYFQKASFPDTRQTVLPLQSSGKQVLLSPEVRLDFNFFRHFHLRPQVIYSTLLANDDNALRVPEIFVNTQVAYENFLFKNNLQVQIGVDVNWKSAYFDLGYDPAIQQFYVQDRVLTPSFPLTDVFFNAKMKRGRFFFKYNNLVQAFTQSGYLPTPVYPGQRNILDFGFELLLFD